MIAEYVVCLAEDTTGIIWMGTTEGLQGYDGVGFEHYSTENSGLPTNVFTDIWAEPMGNRLWLGLKSGLAVMDLRTRHIEPFDSTGAQEKSPPTIELTSRDYLTNWWPCRTGAMARCGRME